MAHRTDTRSGSVGSDGGRQPTRRVDRATVVGLVASAVLLFSVVIAGAGFAAGVFWQTSSLSLVVGGSVLATLASMPGGHLRSFWSVLKNAVYVRTAPVDPSIATLVRLAEIARRDGLLSLERPVTDTDDEFLRRAMRMAIDGNDAATIESVVRAELEGIDQRHATGKAVFDSIARFSPVFGMMGTVIGLIIMLGHMEDPTRIGPGMAVALLTTLYGLVLANVFCAPLARKLAYRSTEELLHKTTVLKGVLAIQAGDHPRLVEQKLRAHLPAGQREQRYRPTAVERTVEPMKPKGSVMAPAQVTSPSEVKSPRRELVEAA